MARDKDYRVTHVRDGVTDITLSTLPKNIKRKLWENIKNRDPAKAKVMLDGLALVRQFDPEAKLTLTNIEIEFYLKDD